MIDLAQLQPELRQKVKDIFLDLSELPLNQRNAALVDRCGEDNLTRDAVQSLLDAQVRAGNFLGGDAETAIPESIAESSSIRPLFHRRIGSYELQQVIGEGGFGTVYAADQLHPVRRRVALKILRLGLDGGQVIARFEQERQALALMNHPNIAQVFDAGADPGTGQPYFVMELIEGIPLTRYCDEQKLTARQRLELFIPVCRAVQHAHQKGVIHRDLKPTNVLVTIQDSKPIPKLLDFGIAKAVEARLTDKTISTQVHQLVGTPPYMSPEQAEGSMDIDTRSDVYSLGALLYELLTGTTPFESQELRSKSYAEIQRVIREVDPPRPSTQMQGQGARGEGQARTRLLLTPRPSPLAPDLDWIVMKCLEKERARRYDSAAALATDVQHFLADEPVTARPPSRSYQLRKFVRRNKLAVAASAVVLMVLLAGITGTTIGLVGQSRQRAIAVQQRAAALEQERQARQSAAIAQAVSQFQSDMLASADPNRLLGDKVTVLQAVNGAVKELDAGKLSQQPLVEASVRATIGTTLRALGRYDAAEPNLRRALELRRNGLPATDPSVAQSLSDLATLLANEGKLDQAETLFREALAANRSAEPHDPPTIAANLYNLGVLLQQQRRPVDAESVFREALQLRRKSLPATHPYIAQGAVGLASALRELGQLEEAEQLFREAIAIGRKSLPPEHPEMAPVLSNFAALLAQMDKLDEAELLMREALAIRRKTLPAGHPDIATALGNLAMLLRNKGSDAETEALSRESLRIRRQALPAGHLLIANSLTTLGVILRDRSKLDEAEPISREALAMYQKALPPGHADVTRAQINLAVLLEARGELTEAESLCRDALRNLSAQRGSENWQVANARVALGRILTTEHRFAEAEGELLAAESVLASGRGAPSGRYGQALESLIALYRTWDEQEPGKGFASKAADWKSRLDVVSAPAKMPTTKPPRTSPIP